MVGQVEADDEGRLGVIGGPGPRLRGDDRFGRGWQVVGAGGRG